MAASRVLGWVPFALLGCGRIGFDAPADAPGAAESDAPSVTLIPLCERATGEIVFDCWIISTQPIGCP